MARNGDKGPYAVGNVRIITVEENTKEIKRTNFKWTDKQRANMRVAMQRQAEVNRKSERLQILWRENALRTVATRRRNGLILTDEQRLEIINSSDPVQVLAAKYGRSKVQIYNIKKGNFVNSEALLR